MEGGTGQNNVKCHQIGTEAGVEAVSAKASLTVDTQVEVLGFFASCIHDTALVAGLVPKTGTFYPQNLAPVCNFQVGITKKRQPNQTTARSLIS